MENGSRSTSAWQRLQLRVRLGVHRGAAGAGTGVVVDGVCVDGVAGGVVGLAVGGVALPAGTGAGVTGLPLVGTTGLIVLPVPGPFGPAVGVTGPFGFAAVPVPAGSLPVVTPGNTTTPGVSVEGCVIGAVELSELAGAVPAVWAGAGPCKCKSCSRSDVSVTPAASGGAAFGLLGPGAVDSPSIGPTCCCGGAGRRQALMAANTTANHIARATVADPSSVGAFLGARPPFLSEALAVPRSLARVWTSRMIRVRMTLRLCESRAGPENLRGNFGGNDRTDFSTLILPQIPRAPQRQRACAPAQR